MIKKLVLLMFMVSASQAATYYISPTGNNDTGNGSADTPWLTLAKAFTGMTGGDTLIVKDGTYTGTANQITADQRPPIGSAGAWTIIKAEHDGEAVFDGEATRSMVSVQYVGDNENHSPSDAYSHPMYYQFEGILWAKQGGTSPQFVRCRGLKFLRCGTYDTADGTNSNFNVNRCADVLMENCYSYGSGRYKFHVYCSTQVVLRQCVARMDRVNPESEVIALFSIYSGVNVEVQNCIAIDSDQNANYLNVADRAGSFCVPSTDWDANNITFNRCVALNNCFGGLFTSGNNHHSYNVLFKDCAVIDIQNNTEYSLNFFKGTDGRIENCTFIGGSEVNGGVTPRGFTGDGGTNNSMKNSIIANYTAGWGIIAMTEDYNTVWNSTGTNAVEGGNGVWCQTNGSGSYGYKGTNTITTNPIWSLSNTDGAIKYAVRTEIGNSLATVGEGGTQIGANCTKMIGVSGTMWGETGYNTPTDTPMWPFPNETLIRAKMKAYTGGGVSGDRGFCADGTTLTKYIWEYLGNQAPAEFSTSSNNTGTVINGPLTLSGQGTLK